MDRAPQAPTQIPPLEPAPAVRAGIADFARRVDAGDPFVAAFANSLTAMMVSDPTLPDNPIVYVNAAFEALTGYAADEVIGRNCRVLQGPLTDAGDVAQMRRAIDARVRTTLDLLNHRRDGTPFWNRLMIAPVFDADGAVRWFVASQVDVTVERHRLAQVQQHRDALEAEVAARRSALALALKAGGLGTWVFDPRREELTASNSCKAAFGRTPDQSFSYAEFLAAIHADDRARVEVAIADTARDGVPYRIEYRILTPAGEQRWVGVRAEMQPGAGGVPVMSGFVTDISDRKFAEEHRAVLARELTHRVKNTLATVGAVVSQTLRDAASLTEARRAVAGRIASLGTAHELLIEEEVDGAAIGDIVSRVLAPFADSAGERFVVEGPAIRLSPEITLALSMALYELATNAVKYGALSVPGGSVAIRWALCGGDGSGGDGGGGDGGAQSGGRRFAFSWVETGGPAVEAPTRTGFGTRMIERVFSPHVRGTATITYPREGARFAIEARV